MRQKYFAVWLISQEEACYGQFNTGQWPASRNYGLLFQLAVRVLRLIFCDLSILANSIDSVSPKQNLKKSLT